MLLSIPLDSFAVDFSTTINMARLPVIAVAILAICIAEISCYKIIRLTYRPPRTRRPIIRRARDVEFVKPIGESKELYNEDDGMFTDRPYFGDEENRNGTPLKKEETNDDQSSGYNGDQDSRPVKESDTDHDSEGKIYNGPSANVERDNDHLERSARSVKTAGAKRVLGRPGDKNSRLKWSKIAHRNHDKRHRRALQILPNPVYNDPFNPRTWRPIGKPKRFFFV